MEITLSYEEKQCLEKHVSSRSSSVRLEARSGIILLAAEGLENKVIAQELKVPPNKVKKWWNRFA